MMMMLSENFIDRYYKDPIIQEQQKNMSVGHYAYEFGTLYLNSGRRSGHSTVADSLYGKYRSLLVTISGTGASQFRRERNNSDVVVYHSFFHPQHKYKHFKGNVQLKPYIIIMDMVSYYSSRQASMGETYSYENIYGYFEAGYIRPCPVILLG